jgi:hypothetical protein
LRFCFALLGVMCLGHPLYLVIANVPWGPLAWLAQWLVDREERGLLCRVIRLETTKPKYIFGKVGKLDLETWLYPTPCLCAHLVQSTSGSKNILLEVYHFLDLIHGKLDRFIEMMQFVTFTFVTRGSNGKSKRVLTHMMCSHGHWLCIRSRGDCHHQGQILLALVFSAI